MPKFCVLIKTVYLVYLTLMSLHKQVTTQRDSASTQQRRLLYINFHQIQCKWVENFTNGLY